MHAFAVGLAYSGCVRGSHNTSLILISPGTVNSTAGGTNTHMGKYAYTEELLALEAASDASDVHGDVHGEKVVTEVGPGFLPVDQWSAALNSHPDRAFVAFLLHGISCGFRIGFSRSCQLKPPPGNFR